jgi:hypothetical protein
MNTLHMISEIPMAGETVPRNTTLAAFVGVKVWFVPMSMHTISFTLIAKKDRSRRETGIPADSDLAPVRFQVGVHLFAIQNDVVNIRKG